MDPAENAVELQYIQVPPDRGARGAAFGHELIDAHMLPMAQEFTDAAVALFSTHVQMLARRDHLIICCVNVVWPLAGEWDSKRTTVTG